MVNPVSVALEETQVGRKAALAVRHVAVILPVFNEQEIIAETIDVVLERAAPLIKQLTVIVVDDGSRDNSAQIIDNLAQRDPRIVPVHHPSNRGYGGALRSGFQKAVEVDADAAFFMDADGQFDIAELAQFLPLLNRYDAVIGYRIDRKDPFIRRLNARAWNTLVTEIFGIRSRDIDCAFKLFRIDFLRQVQLESDSALINTELLARFNKVGLHSVEIGVHHYPREAGTPTGAKPAVVVKAFRDLFALRQRINQSVPVAIHSIYVPRPGDNGVRVGVPLARTKQATFLLSLLGLFVLATYLRYRYLGYASLWLDELGEGITAKLPMTQLLARVRQDAGAAPLDYIMVKFVTSLLGYSTAATRAWSFIISSISIPLMGITAWRIFKSRFIGLVAAFLLAFSAYHIYYSHEARFYSFLVFATLVNLLTFQLALEKGSWLRWLAYAAAVTLGFYVHYFTGIFLPFEGLVVLFIALNQSEASGWDRAVINKGIWQVGFCLGAMLIAVALFGPWLHYATFSQLGTPSTVYATPDIHLGILQYALNNLLNVTQISNLTLLSSLMLFLALLGVLIETLRRHYYSLVLGTIVVIGVPLTLLIDKHVQYFYDARQDIFLLPLIYMLAASGGCSIILALVSWLTSSTQQTLPQNARGEQNLPALLYGTSAKTLFTVLFCGVLVLLSKDGIHSVYQNVYQPKADWASAAHVIAPLVCSDSTMFAALDGSYDFGVGWYEPSLLAIGQPLPDLTPTTLHHDDIILRYYTPDPNITASVSETTLTNQGFVSQHIDVLEVYYNPSRCSP